MDITNMFNGMFGKIKNGMCRIAVNGQVAIATSSGYKTYDVKSGTLTNCDNFAFDIGQDWFFVIPTNKVQKGDIILASGKPRCVIEVNNKEIKTFCYENGTIDTIIPERHMFLGKQYFYGKIVSLFGNMMGKKNGMGGIMKFMLMSEMMGGNKNGHGITSEGMGNMLPMMMMMGGGSNFMDGMFDFGVDEDEDEGEDTEEKED